METFIIPEVVRNEPGLSLTDISTRLDIIAKNSIEFCPWTFHAENPKVSFVIAHNGDFIFLKYYVLEAFVKAAYFNINEPVYKDSCVEFFIAVEGDDAYYNFEFNCIGTCLLGYGKNKHDRKLLPGDAVNTIQHIALVKSMKDIKKIYWELTLQIPISIFNYHKPAIIKGLQCNVNFFKCGDDLPQQHFLSWTDIKSSQPNFHLPQFFRKAVFQ